MGSDSATKSPRWSSLVLLCFLNVIPQMSERTNESARSTTLLLVLLLLAALANFLLDSLGAQKFDFDVFQTAARAVLAGKGHQLYQTGVQDAFSAGLWINGRGYFYHPAYEVLTFLPFVHFSRTIAFWLWNGLQCGFIFFSALKIAAVLPSHVRYRKLIVAAAFAIFPTASLVWWGQDSGFLLFCFAMAFVAFAEEKCFRTGLWLGASVFKFQYALPMALILILRRKSRRLATGFLVSASTAFIVSWVIVGDSALRDYLVLITHGHGHQDILRMPNLRSLVELTHAQGNLAAVITGVLSIVLFVAALKSPRNDATTEFSLAVVTALLVSYHSFAYDFILLLFPIFAALKASQFAPKGSTALWLACLQCAPFWFVLDRMSVSGTIVVPILLLAYSLVRNPKISGPELSGA